jgi:CBS-domain-containing membrane protein
VQNKKVFNNATKKLISKFSKKRSENDEKVLKNISEKHDIDFDDLKRVINNIKDDNNGRKRISK